MALMTDDDDDDGLHEATSASLSPSGPSSAR